MTSCGLAFLFLSTCGKRTHVVPVESPKIFQILLQSSLAINQQEIPLLYRNHYPKPRRYSRNFAAGAILVFEPSQWVARPCSPELAIKQETSLSTLIALHGDCSSHIHVKALLIVHPTGVVHKEVQRPGGKRFSSACFSSHLLLLTASSQHQELINAYRSSASFRCAEDAAPKSLKFAQHDDSRFWYSPRKNEPRI